MDPKTLETLSAIGSLADTLSSVAFLVILILAFYRGTIVSRVIVDRMIKAISDQTALLARELRRDLAELIRKAAADGVKEGFIAAMQEIDSRGTRL